MPFSKRQSDWLETNSDDMSFNKSKEIICINSNCSESKDPTFLIGPHETMYAKFFFFFFQKSFGEISWIVLMSCLLFILLFFFIWKEEITSINAVFTTKKDSLYLEGMFIRVFKPDTFSAIIAILHILFVLWQGTD